MSDSNTLKKLYDINGAIGGPIKRDRVWFYFTSRYFTNEYYMAGQYYPVDPSVFARVEDLTRQAFAGTWTADNNIRITWSPTAKQKVSGWYAYQRKDDPHWLQQILFMSPEAAQVVHWPTQLSTITWTYAATNRLLFEAGFAPGASPDTITQPPETIAGIPIFEVGSATTRQVFAYRSSWFQNYDDHLPSQTYKASLSYVTGSHNLKVGMSMQHGHCERNDSVHAQGDRYYLTSGYSPFYVNIFSPLAGWTSNLNRNLGLYGQDSWTLRRLTLNGGLRLDFRTRSASAFTQHLAGCEQKHVLSGGQDVPNWKDVNPRSAAPVTCSATARRPSREREPWRATDSVWHCEPNPGNTIATTVGVCGSTSAATACGPT